MTVTKLFASGYEPLSETIRYLIASNWTESLEPKFLSPSGHGAEQASNTEYNFGNKWSRFDNQNVIKFYDGASEELAHGRYFSEFQTTVFIDVFAKTSMHIALLTDEVDRIIFENQPNVTRRIQTSAGGNSRVTGFRQNTIPWVYPSGLSESGASIQAAGELDCKWQVHLS